MDPIIISLGQAKLLAVGAFTALSASMGGLWYLMNGNIVNWKELYKAKTDELAALRDSKDKEIAAARLDRDDARAERDKAIKYPAEHIGKYIEVAEEFMSKKIQDLYQTVDSLKSELERKSKEIITLRTKNSHDEDRLVTISEQRDNLQKKIAAYEVIIQKIMSQRRQAEDVRAIFTTELFKVEELNLLIDAELEDKMRDIDASSYSGIKQSVKNAHANAQAKRDVERKRSMEASADRLKRAEEIQERRMLCRTQANR